MKLVEIKQKQKYTKTKLNTLNTHSLENSKFEMTSFYSQALFAHEPGTAICFCILK